jgi:glycosyltransferase involved in cell wall biosynthesis
VPDILRLGIGKHLRILHIISTLNPEAGGPTESVRILLDYGPSDAEGEVVTLDDPAASYLANFDFPIHALGPTSTTFGFNAKLRPWLKANRDRFDGVIVHGLWQYCGYAAMRVFAGNTSYFVFPHGMLDPYFKRTFPMKHLKKWLYWLLAEYWVLRRADRVLFTTQTEESLAKQSFFIHRWNGYVVPFGACGPSGSPEVQAEAFYRACPPARGRRLLVYLGRIHPKKGCDILMDAYAEAALWDPGLDLVMAGPDPLLWSDELKRTALSKGISHRVHWPGMLRGDAKWGAFFASEAFILPSHQENFGIAVAEALACGRPALLTDKVNIAEDIAADGAGLMESDSFDGILHLLKEWITMTPAERKTMGLRALACYDRRYDMRQSAKAIIGLFEKGNN